MDLPLFGFSISLVNSTVNQNQTMNATTTTRPSTDFMEDNAAGSDSDASLDDALPSDYYQPISAVEDGDGDFHDDAEDSDQLNSDEDHDFEPATNGFSSLHLNGEIEHKRSEEEEEEERIRQASDSAVARAFREDESRRNAPLPAENAARVMEAMRGVSFGGVAPDWAAEVPEDRWINQLRRLRQSPMNASTIGN